VLVKLRLKISHIFRVYFKNYYGQISKQSDIGRWILCLSSLSEVNSIVEIGTWNGAGSSRLIAKGVSLNPAKLGRCLVFGLEIDASKAKVAKKRLKRYKFFKVLHGRIIEESDFDTKGLVGNENKWLSQDLLNLRNCPNVLRSIPSEIDLLILDGGEFSTYSEFHILKSRITKYVILDDVFTRKCKKILDEVKDSNEFELIYYSGERNGTAVLKKK